MQEAGGLDLERVKAQIEWLMAVANFVVGLSLTFGGLGLAVYWRIRFGGYGSIRAFYLHTAWAFGALQLVAAAAMIRRWPIRWITQMLPLAVPVFAYQWFVVRFIFKRL
jgi:hypothetical protein